ncbi:helix-turn-helix domain-containing protein [Acetobacterium carbinolicum]|uniref:helix-turn-helix domain-containing protein n=1 Tax=Acetobacterium carbinolicum TaxID=52690 RepID=UPI0039C94563
MNADGVGTKIKILREKARFSQKYFAIYLGIDQTQVVKFEEGDLQLNINQLEKICDLFSCSFKDLIDEKSDEPEQDNYFDFSTITSDDLTGISKINKIARNLKEMNILLTDGLIQ